MWFGGVGFSGHVTCVLNVVCLPQTASKVVKNHNPKKLKQPLAALNRISKEPKPQTNSEIFKLGCLLRQRGTLLLLGAGLFEVRIPGWSIFTVNGKKFQTPYYLSDFFLIP